MANNNNTIDFSPSLMIPDFRTLERSPAHSWDNESPFLTMPELDERDSYESSTYLKPRATKMMLRPRRAHMSILTKRHVQRISSEEEKNSVKRQRTSPGI
jgi:hypothetical protein